MNDIQAKIQAHTKTWDIDVMVNAIIADEPDLAEHADDLKRSLIEAKQGKHGRITYIPISPITETRNRTGLSQTKFAQALGISVNTLRSWEQGQRKPSGAAATLLGLLSKHPELVAELNYI